MLNNVTVEHFDYNIVFICCDFKWLLCTLLQRTSTNKPRKLISSPVQFQVTKFYFYVILSILTKSFWFITKGQVLFLYLYSDNDIIISFQFYNLSLIFTSLLQINFEFKLLRNFISFVRKFWFFLFIFKCSFNYI